MSLVAASKDRSYPTLVLHSHTEGHRKTSEYRSFERKEPFMSDAPKKPGLDGRAREKSGQIEHKHPTTKIKHLRVHYGSLFAPGWDGDRTLGELLKETKFESLTQYVKHHGHHSEDQTQ
jgi:hypothetical protein